MYGFRAVLHNSHFVRVVIWQRRSLLTCPVSAYFWTRHLYLGETELGHNWSLAQTNLRIPNGAAAGPIYVWQSGHDGDNVRIMRENKYINNRQFQDVYFVQLLLTH